MSHDSSHDAADSMGNDSLRGEAAVAQRVEHGSVCTQVTTPAHTDGGEYSDSISVSPTLSYEVGYEAKSRTYSTECCDGEGYQVGIGEAEEELEYEVNLSANHGRSATPSYAAPV